MADIRGRIVRSISSNMTGKRINVKLLWAVLCLALLTGCGNKVEENVSPETKESIEAQPEATPEVTPEPTAKPKEWSGPEDYRVVDTYVMPESIADSRFNM